MDVLKLLPCVRVVRLCFSMTVCLGLLVSPPVCDAALTGSFSLFSSTPVFVSMEECAFASTAFLLPDGVRGVYRRTLHDTGRVILAAVQRRSSPPAQPRGPRTTASELFYLKLKIRRVFSVGPSWCFVCVCGSDCKPHLVDDPLHKFARIHSDSTPSRPRRLRSRTTPARCSWKLSFSWSTKNMRDSWILVNSTLWPQQSLKCGGCSSSVRKMSRWWRRDIGKWSRKAGSATNFPSIMHYTSYLRTKDCCTTMATS